MIIPDSRLEALGLVWRNGISKKQPVNDGVSPDAYQLHMTKGTPIFYRYSVDEVLALLSQLETDKQNKAFLYDDSLKMK